MPLVSVVTPVYNGEQYLAECIESVLAQSFDDFEFIILNNCSSDRSGSIAEHYAKKDPRIRVHCNTEVLPVISSFNRAATLVSPDARYLKFLCADDTLFPGCLQEMVHLAESNPTVQLVTSYKIHGQAPVSEGPPFPQAIVCGKDVCKWFFQGKLGVLGSVTDHLIRLPTLSTGGRLFDENFLHADIDFYVRLLTSGADYGFVHQVLTFTRVHDASVSQFSHLMGTGPVENLAMLLKDGEAFLTEVEKRALVRSTRRDYSRFLFRVFLKMWDREIWKYQVACCKKFGIRMSMLEVFRAGLLETAASALSPRNTARRLKHEYARMTKRREYQQLDVALPTGRRPKPR